MYESYGDKNPEEATAMFSSITEIAMHPAYQQIIGMGSIAIPFIMRELENRPAHWFWALKSITGEDPVSKKGFQNYRTESTELQAPMHRNALLLES